jgi:phosphopantetheine binding protein/AMP-binding enzyme
VVDAVVRGVGVDDEVRLVAWVVPSPHGATPTVPGLRAHVGRLLPDWMVPRDVVLITELPRNERGKVDISALPPVPLRTVITAPETETETALVQIWAPILQLEHVGREGSFTALGGESLAVEEMLAAVEARFAVRLTYQDLFDHPTLAQFAARVDGAQRPRGSGWSGAFGRLGTVGRQLRSLVREDRQSDER